MEQGQGFDHPYAEERAITVKIWKFREIEDLNMAGLKICSILETKEDVQRRWKWLFKSNATERSS